MKSINGTRRSGMFFRRLRVEALEDRTLLDAVPDLLVSSLGTNQVKRFDGATGMYEGNFASATLSGPVGLAYGPDNNLYVASATNRSVKRYDGVTGEYLGNFITVEPGPDQLGIPYQIAFGPDGNLYLTDYQVGRIRRYNGSTGAFLDNMAWFGSSSGNIFDLTFGPDGALYVALNNYSVGVIRIDITTGLLTGFTNGTPHGGIPQGLTFGPDGNLYVAWGVSNVVSRYNGTTGAFMDIFATLPFDSAGSPTFGPDGNLYLTQYFSDLVARYSGTTGAFLDNFAVGGGLDGPADLIFLPPSGPPPNQPPFLAPIADHTIPEGSPLIVDADATDLDTPVQTLAYSLVHAPVGATIDPVTGLISWTPNDDTGAGWETFTIRVTDSGASPLSDERSFRVTVTNVAPTAALNGPSTGVTDQPRPFDLAANDPAEADRTAGFTYRLDWDGDGTWDEDVTGPGSRTVAHAYPIPGNYTIRMLSRDKEGDESGIVTRSISIGVVDVQGADLVVGGTVGGDVFTIRPGAAVGEVVVARNGATMGTFAPTSAVRVYGGTGDDAVVVTGNGVANQFDLYHDEVRFNGLPILGTSVELWRANGLPGNDTFTYYGGTSTIHGNGGADTLITAGEAANVWAITASNAGSLNGVVPFQGIERLVGGEGPDRFAFSDGASVSGAVHGGGGPDTLDYSFLTTPISVNIQTLRATRAGDISSIEEVVGGSAHDTLTGPDLTNVWSLVGIDAGTLNGSVSFRNVENLTGGRAADAFVLATGAVLRGTLNGAGGSDTLDYSGHVGPVTINLQSRVASGLSGFASISNLIGSAGPDTLIGRDTTAIWLLHGPNAGSVSSLSFAAVENLTGGGGTNTFRFQTGASVAGRIDGGADGARLDYSSFGAAVSVNLTLGVATGAGSVQRVAHVTGGVGDDLLVGDGADNVLEGGSGNDLLFGGGGTDVLEGGSGRDILVGGSGADALDGGSGDDLLLSGLLSFFDEPTGAVQGAALTALREEWTRTDLSYAQRVAHLTGTTGGGLNGSYRIDNTTTWDDGALDTLFGRGGLDWFLIGIADGMDDPNIGGIEMVTPL